MRTRGFTIVEIIITVTIMGILLTLGVFSWNSAQINARDDERIADIEALQLGLESFYRSGTDGSTSFGRYANTNMVASVANIKLVLRDADSKSFTAPGISDPLQTLIAATNAHQTTTGVTPQPTISQYVYQPIKSDGTLCTIGDVDCRKYNLYYRLEADNTVYKVTSKNQ